MTANAPRASRNPLALVVLRFLHERPMHPYEMRRLFQERYIQNVVKLRGGSLYHTVERLEQAGLVEPVETAREGRYPERTVYRLTEEGREELDDWLRELLSMPVPEYPQFGVAVAFLSHLPPAEVRQLLTARTIALAASVAALEGVRQSLSELIGRIHALEIEYVLARQRAELEWVRTTIADLESGRLTWEPASMHEDIAL
jgi:DNA-binding PadR family transcriptional regulator